MSVRRLAPLALSLALFVTGCPSEEPITSPDGGIEDLAQPAPGDLASPSDAGAIGDASSPTDAAMPPEVVAFCSSFATAICTGTETCSCPGASTRSSCITELQTLCETRNAALVGLVTLGKIRFDAARATACVQAVQAFTQTCKTPTDRNQPAPCLETFVDNAALGSRCSGLSGRLLCANGQGVCVPGGPGTTPLCTSLPGATESCDEGRCLAGLACVSGVCRGLATQGQTCATSTECAAGLVCGVANTCALPAARIAACGTTEQCASGLTCEVATCVDAPAIGATCDERDPTSCGSERVCIASKSPRTCQPLGQLDDRCAFDDCIPSLVCDVTASSPTCRPLPTMGTPCIQTRCAAGLACDGNNTCVTPLTVDQSCVVNGSQPCAAGLGCDPGTNSCQPAGSDGQPCTNGLCAVGAICDYGTPALCHVPGGVGTPCMGQDVLCSAGHYCDVLSGQCATVNPVGATCTSDAACAAGSICEFVGSGLTGSCKALPSTVGATCVDRCAGALRCVQPAGACAPGACTLRR